jgi:hypothetical protein
MLARLRCPRGCDGTKQGLCLDTFSTDWNTPPPSRNLKQGAGKQEFESL